MLRLTLLIPLLTLCAAPALAQKATKKVDFAKQIWPILEKRCIDCHKAPYVDKNGRKRKPKGRVELDTLAGIKKSKRGKVVKAGDADNSLLYEVIVLPADDEDIMPPSKKGKPLSKTQTDLIKRWIDQGANYGKWTGEKKSAKKTGKTTGKDKKTGTGDAKKNSGSGKSSSGKSSSGKSGKAEVSPLLTLSKRLKPVSQETLASFAKSPFRVRSVGDDNPLLQVTCYGQTDAIDDAALEELAPIASHIAELNLAATQITDKAGAAIAQMPRLVTLDVRQTAIGNHGVAALGKCKELRRINLYGTKVGDYGLAALGNLSHLRKVHVWQTEVSANAALRLRESVPGVEVVMAADLPEPMADNGNSGRRRRR